MPGYGRRDDRRPGRDDRRPLRDAPRPQRDEQGPARDPYAPAREDVFTIPVAAAEQREKPLVCDTCGLSFVSPPYRVDDKCPSGDVDYPCRGRLQTMEY